MQSSSRSRPFKSGLIGASPITDAICSQGVISSARRFAKAEVRGANPRESTILPLCLSSHRTSFVNSYSSVRVRPEAPVYGDHDVTAASRPVKVPPWRDAGANPVGHPNFDGPKIVGYPPPSGGRTVRGESLGGPGSIPGMECLRSITSLVHRHLPEQRHSLCSAQNRIHEVCAQATTSRTVP